jgi:hypothetical protein
MSGAMKEVSSASLVAEQTRPTKEDEESVKLSLVEGRAQQSQTYTAKRIRRYKE